MRELLRPVPLLALVAAFVLGAGVWWVFRGGDACGGYVYVDQDFACDARRAIAKTEYVPLQNDIIAYINEASSKGQVSDIAVFFRDLDDGPSFGVNAGNAFAPASLLKLPVILTFFSIEEDMPGILDKKLLYDHAALDRQFDIPRQVNFDFAGEGLVDGQEYPVRELMRAAIAYSDNYAYFALLKYINLEYPGGTELVLKTLQDLGVIDPRTPEEETVTVRNYSALFRLLYSAAFLSTDDSEEVLSWLAQSSFDAGLQAGVPQGTPVASKFGEREEGENRRLHDCGIVYYPGNPYTLCIMTRGNDWASLKKAIGDISAMVYQEVDRRAH